MLKTVLIGTAHMHVNEIADYVSGCEDTELCAVYDPPAAVAEDMEKRYTRAWNLKNVSGKYGTPVYTDLEKMLDEVKPDVAFILSENYKKPELAECVAKRGINVIVEKPMACTGEEALALHSLKERYGVEIYVNWPVAWRPHVNGFFRAVADRVVGEPIKLRYVNGHTGPLGRGARHRGVSANAEEMTDEERSRTWWYDKAYGGGAYLDILCYGAFFSLASLGMPSSVYSYGANLTMPFAKCEDNVAAILRYDGALSVCEGTWTTPRARIPAGPEMICTDGVIYCEGGPDGKAEVRVIDYKGERVEYALPEDISPYANIAECYSDHVLRGKEMPRVLTTEFNLDIVSVIDAADLANKEGREIAPTLRR